MVSIRQYLPSVPKVDLKEMQRFAEHGAASTAVGSLVTLNDPRGVAIQVAVSKILYSPIVLSINSLRQAVKKSEPGLIEVAAMALFTAATGAYIGQQAARQIGYDPHYLSGFLGQLIVLPYYIYKGVQEINNIKSDDSKITFVTDDNFQKEVIESEIPVAVDIYTNWCGPCKLFSPTFSKYSFEMEGKVKFCKVDLEKATAVGGRFPITSIPTLLFFKNGELVDSYAGLLGDLQFKGKLDELVKPEIAS